MPLIIFPFTPPSTLSIIAVILTSPGTVSISIFVVSEKSLLSPVEFIVWALNSWSPSVNFGVGNSHSPLALDIVRPINEPLSNISIVEFATAVPFSVGVLSFEAGLPYSSSKILSFISPV